MDYSLPGSSVHGTLQARILEWVAISISRGVFPIQATNLGLLHCRQTLCHLSPQGALFTTAKSRKDTKGPYRRCGTHIHEYMKWNITQPLKRMKPAICSSPCNMDWPRDYHTKWNNSERQIPYDITYTWNLKYDTNVSTKQKLTHRHRGQICGCQGGEEVGGEGLGDYKSTILQ